MNNKLFPIALITIALVLGWYHKKKRKKKRNASIRIKVDVRKGCEMLQATE